MMFLPFRKRAQVKWGANSGTARLRWREHFAPWGVVTLLIAFLRGRVSMLRMLISILSEKAMKILLIHSVWLLFVLAFSSVNAVVCDKNQVLKKVGVANSFQYPSNDTFSGQDFQPEIPPNPGCGKVGGCSPGHLGEDWQIKNQTQYDEDGMYVYAIANGCVTGSDFLPKGSGNLAGYVIMKHYLPNGSYVLSVYFHLRKEDTENNKLQNTSFKKGEIIALTANSTEMKNSTTFDPHLHFEICGTSDQINWGKIDGWKGGDILEQKVYIYAYKKLSEHNFLEGAEKKIIAYKKDFGGYFNPAENISESHEGSRTNNILNHRGFIDYWALPKHFEDFLCVFTDIIEGEQYGAHQEAIKKLCLKGIIKGYGDGTFGPSKSITRAEFSKLITLTKLVDERGIEPGRLPSFEPTDKRMWDKTQLELNVAKKPIADYFVDEKNLSEVIEPFLDVNNPNDLDQWYYPYVNILGRLGIIGGFSRFKGDAKREFRPSDPITRAQMVKMVIKGLGNVQVTENIAKGTYWAINYLDCAQQKLKIGETLYSLILHPSWSEVTRQKCEESYPNDSNSCLIGEENATRAETAYAIHRLREFQKVGKVANSCKGL